ncbi:MAG TPA: hypothetical protein VHP58_03675 [Alphaproteobacteria bacterium]|nr:hypothetical protein [Alphaproteobacteria bacterium]
MLRQIKLFFIDYFHMMGIYLPANLTEAQRQVLSVLSPQWELADFDGSIRDKFDSLLRENPNHHPGRPRTTLGYILTLLDILESKGMVCTRRTAQGDRLWYRTPRGNRYATPQPT